VAAQQGVARVVWRYLRLVLPAIDRELEYWRCQAARIPEPELRHQALESIRLKKFHCQGGAVYAAGASSQDRELLRFIVALQTISDYLDNLCDRSGIQDAEAFRLLHKAMLDAVTSHQNDIHTLATDYYRLYPYKDDGGYLHHLVSVCKQSITSLCYYDQVEAHVLRLVGLYCDLQVYKHIASAERVPKLTAWFAAEWQGNTDLLWQEYAAAAGSTLGVFALCHAAIGPYPPEPIRLLDLYFPWMASLHIMLDYFIDLEEDRRGGDLNFVSYYSDLDEAEARISRLYREAMMRVDKQVYPALHAVAMHGLPALYLSDNKVTRQGQQRYARHLLRVGGVKAWGLHAMCRLYRHVAEEEAPASPASGQVKEKAPV
jgi:tetraprenyl-beta-curcumene synthase